jgi:ATP-dependent helicase/DNAse subunit B
MNYLKSDFLQLTAEAKAGIELAAMLQPHLKPTEVWQALLQPLLELEQTLKLCGSSAMAAQTLKKFLHQIVFQGSDIFKCDRRDVFAFEELARTFMEVDAHFEAGYEFERYLEQLATAIEIHLVSMPAPTHDAVQVYTVSLARQKEYRVVLVAGLVEKQFPKQVFENPLFSDEERRFIHPHLALASSRRQNESYLYYLALTRAREQLFLSHPQYNAESQKNLIFFLSATNPTAI